MDHGDVPPEPGPLATASVNATVLRRHWRQALTSVLWHARNTIDGVATESDVGFGAEKWGGEPYGVPHRRRGTHLLGCGTGGVCVLYGCGMMMLRAMLHGNDEQGRMLWD